MPPKTLAERMRAISETDKSKKRGKEVLSEEVPSFGIKEIERGPTDDAPSQQLGAEHRQESDAPIRYETVEVPITASLPPVPVDDPVIKRRRLTKAVDKNTSIPVPSAHASLERIIKDVSGPVREGDNTSASSLPAISEPDVSIPDVPIVFPHTLPIGSGFDMQIPDQPALLRPDEPVRSEGNISSGSGPVIRRKRGTTQSADSGVRDSSIQRSGSKVLTHRKDNVLPVNVNAVKESLRAWKQNNVQEHLRQFNLEESCAHFQWSMASTVLWGDRVVAFCNQNNSEMKSRISHLEEDNKRLSENLLLKDAEITKIGEEKKLISGELEKLQKAHGSLKAEHENLQVSLSLSEQAATTLRLDLDSCKNERDSLTDENRKLSDTISELNHNASIENDLKKILQSRLKNVEGERNLLSEQLKAKEVLLSNAQNEILSAQKSNEAIKGEKTSLQSELNKSWKKNMELEAKLNAAEKRELSDDEIRKVTSEVYSILGCVHSVEPSINFHQTSYDEVLELYFAKCFVAGEQNENPVAEENRAEVFVTENLNPDVVCLEGNQATSASEKETPDVTIHPSSTSVPKETPEREKVMSDPDPIYKAILAESELSPVNVEDEGKVDNDPRPMPIIQGRDHEVSIESPSAIIEIEDDIITEASKTAPSIPDGGSSKNDKVISSDINQMATSEADLEDRSSTVRRKEDPPEMRQLRSEIQELKAVQEKILRDRAKKSGEALEAKLLAEARRENVARYTNWDFV